MDHTIERRHKMLNGDVLLEIADVIDEVCSRRRLAPDVERHLRAGLYELLETPTQEIWERACNLDVLPHYLPGLDNPSPIGLTLADIVYISGMPDAKCPSREDLLAALRHAITADSATGR